MQKIKIITDSREVFSGIPSILSSVADVEIRQIPVGDYILSERVCIERKTMNDFIDSIIKKRIFDQIVRLKEAYEKPVIIIENEEFERKFNMKALYGAIACVLVDYNIPIIKTESIEETSFIIYSIACREQLKNKRGVALRGKKPKMELKEWQQFIVEGLPDVSAVLAKRLLTRFKSVRNVMNAGIEELKQVEGIGEKKAKRIVDILDAIWED
ncbi:MAG: ERCC4 domain-containing protein [Candidatus Thermoplasmatota archaeon]